MNLAEQKVELMKIVADADEELTGKLIELAKTLNQKNSKFSNEELNKFHATREKYLASTNKTILLEDAHAYIRSLKEK